MSQVSVDGHEEEARQHQQEESGGAHEAATLPIRSQGMVPLVTLGGSVGATAALQDFFRSVGADCGLAFAVVMHRGGDENGLGQALRQSTSLPVVSVTRSQRIEPGTIYLIPPGRSIRTANNSLVTVSEESGADRSPHVAVDQFLRRVASTHGPQAAAVILSGDEPDGAIGLKRIKEHGGLTIAQEPEEAASAGMPRAAIGTGMVDWVLPVAHMAERLRDYFLLGNNLRLPAEEGPPAAPAALSPAAEVPGDDEAILNNVLALLRNRTGRDFSYYKRATIVRRIARRMQVNGTDNLLHYLNVLRTLPGEAGALLQDLLISVTNFFRDADCYDALESRLGELLAGKGPDDALRVWVAACATGEEAYTLAILLMEQARERDTAPVIQIFATDLDQEALRTARAGLYPSTIEADVSPERLRRWFIPEHGGYRVRRELREMVLFAQHDVLKDSPFSRLDLVSCRNLLIYLNRQAQRQLFQTFHFSLRPHGLMFLGASEAVGDAHGLFAVVNKASRLFAQRPQAQPVLPVLGGRGSAGPALPHRLVGSELPVAGARPPENAGALQPQRAAEARAASAGELHLKMLEALAPPSILVDGEYDILHMSASVGRFLQFSGGEPSTNLLRAVHPSLRIELRACLFQASQSAGTAEFTITSVELGGEAQEVRVQVSPSPELGADRFLVTIDARPSKLTGTVAVPSEGEAGPALRGGPDPVLHQLDRELAQLKTNLRDTIDEYEASTEELRASNEELLAMNEELRSATEELETSREELQSINEEISTVNHELKNKVDELGNANSDMHNLMDATQIATVFLDRNLRVMRYTPAAVKLFNLIPTDLGRPLGDLATQLDYPRLSEDAVQVLARLAPIEREVGLGSGQWLLTRLLPYRTMEDRIAGVVMSFIDITRRKQAEETRLWLSAVVASLTDAIISFSIDRTILSWNGGAELIFGYAAEEAIGKPLSLLEPGWTREQEASFTALFRAVPLSALETTARCKDGSTIHVAISAAPIRDHDGKVLGGTALLRDVTQARHAEAALRESEERLRLVIENASDYAIFSMDLERRVTIWSAGAERILGYSEKEIIGRLGDIIFTAEDHAAGAPEAEARTALAEGRAGDDRPHVRKDGSTFWASGALMLMRDPDSQVVGFVKILRDMSAARETQQALERSRADLTAALEENQRARHDLELADVAKDRFLAVLSHELRNPLASIASSAELLRAAPAETDAPARAAQVVQRQSAAMKVLLDDLLDVSRLRLGRLELRRAGVTLGAVVESALEATRPLVEAARHTLTVQLPPQQVELDADPLRLGQVISNLLSNAVKYTPQGGRIALDAEIVEAEVVLTVSDTGIGMESAEIDRMFDLFSQAPEAMDRASGGLGIGLALARSIIELHGGWISASSPGPGKGSQFKVGMPFVSAAMRSSSETVAEPEATPPDSTADLLVLIADDNADAAWGLAKLLELSGYRTVLASGGEEALRIARKERPAVVVLDIGMPDLSGHEVARRMRAAAWGRGAVLIAATGWGQEADQQKSREAGFDVHLTKPLDVRKLKEVITEQLGRRSGS